MPPDANVLGALSRREGSSPRQSAPCHLRQRRVLMLESLKTFPSAFHIEFDAGKQRREDCPCKFARTRRMAMASESQTATRHEPMARKGAFHFRGAVKQCLELFWRHLEPRHSIYRQKRGRDFDASHARRARIPFFASPTKSLVPVTPLSTRPALRFTFVEFSNFSRTLYFSSLRAFNNAKEICKRRPFKTCI